MRRLIVILSVAAFLAAAGTALAWDGVTVQLSTVPPGLVPGDTWNATLTVLDPSGRPFASDSERPAVVIRNVETGLERLFSAVGTDEPGVFRVSILFPEAGTWSYRAEVVRGDLEAPNEIFPAITVGSPPALSPATPAGFSWVSAGIGAGAALGFLLLALARPLTRRRLRATVS